MKHGSFIYCFATACLLYFIGNYCGRTFQVTDISKKNSDTDYIYNRIITCIIMMIFSFIFVCIKGYDIYKTSLFIILCTYKCIEAFAESIYSVIQKKEKLYKVGKSMFLKAFISIIIFLILDIITHNLIITSLSILLVNIFIILLYDTKNIKQVGLEKTKFTRQANIRILKIGFFTFILTFLATYLINSPRYAIDDLLQDSLQTIFGIIIMPATFMSLLGQYIIQPSLTKLAYYIENNKYEELKKLIKKLILLILGLGLFVLFIAYFLEVPILELIYGVGLKNYFISMMIIIVGSILYSLSTLLSAILIAMRKILVQTIIYTIVSIVSTIISYILVNKIQIQGASIAYTITMFITASSLFIITVINMIKYKKNFILKKNILNDNIY